MATQPISMNIIKQVLIRLSQKESVRKIAAALHISKNTVSRYKALSEADPMSTRDLIALEDTVLNHRYKFVKALIDSGCEGFREDADELAPPASHSNIRGKEAFAS